jgi:hypothetical protein
MISRRDLGSWRAARAEAAAAGAAVPVVPEGEQAKICQERSLNGVRGLVGRH